LASLLAVSSSGTRSFSSASNSSGASTVGDTSSADGLEGTSAGSFSTICSTSCSTSRESIPASLSQRQSNPLAGGASERLEAV